MDFSHDQQQSVDARPAAGARTTGRSHARLERLGPLGRGEETPPQAIVLGMHRSGTSALTSLLDRLGLYAGPEDSLMGADEHNPLGYWENADLQVLDEELLAALGGSWTDALEIDPRRLGDAARARFLPRARALIDQLDSYGPWVIKDPRLCLLLPFWRELIEHPLCILIYRDPLAVARSLSRRHGLPILVGIALWEHYNRAALAASQGLPRVLVRHRELIDDPAATASRLVRSLAACGVRGLEGLRELSPADARTLVDSSLRHHADAPHEGVGYLNARQSELLHALESGSALHGPVSPLSAGAREILQEHVRQTREAAAAQTALAQSLERERSLTTALQRLAERIQHVEDRLAVRDTAAAALEHRLSSAERERGDLAAELHREQEAMAALEHRLSNAERERGDLAAELHREQEAVAEREALLSAVFASRSWRLGYGLKRLLDAVWRRRVPTAPERWQSLRDSEP